jgi:hypothetical protein
VTRVAHPAKLARQAAYWRQHGRPDTAERIETVLVASGRCKVCGRLLAREDSIAVGIGPECRRKEDNQ